MTSSDLPPDHENPRLEFGLGELLARVVAPGKASWTDIPEASGVYLVGIDDLENARFGAETGKAKYVGPRDPHCLAAMWKSIQANAPTDIVYIGKGDDLHDRIPSLARFGVGCARNHKGGEWMWQIVGIEAARVVAQSCPHGKQVASEKWLLDTFRIQHGNWPLANRKGGDGSEHWHP